nr:hypothetical protein [Tanacetum cinerariifolium]
MPFPTGLPRLLFFSFGHSLLKCHLALHSKQMANSIALVVFWSTLTIMVIVSFRVQRFRSSVRMEIVFHISNCTVENQIKFATCTLLGSALTWWNSHVKTVSHDVAYAMTWTNLKKKTIKKYYPWGEIKMLEELALMCARMFNEESDKIKRYVGGLPDMIHESVMEFKPKNMQDAIEFTIELIDKKINTFAQRQAKNKRKFDDTSRTNQNQQQSNKKQNIGRAYTDGSGKKKPYRGSKPLYSK